MADGHIAALGGLIASPANLDHLGGDAVGQMRLGLSDSRAALDDIRGRDHHRAWDGGEVLIKHRRELVLVVSARQV